jgi:ribosomal-protein-alanine N-acetyltransferase
VTAMPPAVGRALRVAAMTEASLDAVMALETAVYPFPWTRGNFADALAGGYPAWLLLEADGPGATPLAGYCVALDGVEETHLLNITIAPERRRQGLARRLFAVLEGHARAAGSRTVWLEVRPSNAVARATYDRLGFRSVGVRKGYYPAHGGREDALVLSRDVGPAP